MGELLSVKNINVYYGSIHAIKDVSFHVDEGEIVTLIGANGAGKTTTMHAISGLLKLTSGEITYDGNLISKMEAHKTVRLVLNINGKTTEVKYPVKGMMNSDILYGGGFSTCNITPRSEENRIEEFIANNDSQLEDNRRIPIKYIPEVYYGNKLIWKNPNFANT